MLLVLMVVVWVSAFVASHIPPQRLISVSYSDKTLHFAGFFVLSWMLSLTHAGYRVRRWGRPARVMALLSLYAIMDEVTQPLMNRHFCWGDVVADMLGAAAGILAFELVMAGLPRTRRV